MCRYVNHVKLLQTKDTIGVFLFYLGDNAVLILVETLHKQI